MPSFCPRCAAPNLDTAAACSACGFQLSAPMPSGPQPGAPPPPAGYGQPMGYQPPPAAYGGYYAAPMKTNGLAIGGFVCGIAGILCGLIAIAGLVLSLVGLSQIKKSNGQVGGRGFAIAGIVLSSIFVALNIVFFMIGFIGALAEK